MDDIIVIKDLNFKYEEKDIFQNFNLNIKRGTFTSLLGPNGSGKSTLVKILVGLLKCNSYVKIEGLILSSDNINEIRKKIGIVFENPDNQFVAETVMDDIAFSLENMNFPKDEIKKRIKEIAVMLDIEKIMEQEPHRLSGGEKQLVALASALVIKPSILILDEALTMLDKNIKEKIFEVITNLNRNEGLTVLNITHESEEALYGKEVILLDSGKLILKGPNRLVFKEEDIFNTVGINLPFMAELSIKLGYYGLIDDVILDMNELVDILWK